MQPDYCGVPRQDIRATWSDMAAADLRTGTPPMPCSSGGTVALADRGWSETGRVTAASDASSAFAGYRFPREVISVAVRWYLR
jgi:hypothetical protein